MVGFIRALFWRLGPQAPPNLITLDELVRRGACTRQRDMFKRAFGQSVLVTEELAVKHRHDFDLSWAVLRLLDDVGRVLWETRNGEYFASLPNTHEWNEDAYRSEQWRWFARLLLTNRRR